MKRNLFFALWAVMAALVSCSGPERAIGGGPGVKEAAVEVSGPASSVTAGLADPAQGSAGTADPARGSAGTTDPAAEDAVEAELWTKALALARSLDDRQLAAQVLMAGTDGTEQVPPWMKDIFAEAPPGAVMLFSYNVAGNTDRIAFFLAELKETVAEKSLVPFIAVDHEGGSVNRFARLTGSFPPPLFYGEEAEKTGGEAALGKVYGDARRAAGELKALGITMNLAPVAEILTDDNRVFLGDRSYGGDSAFSGEAASLFVLAMREEGIASAAKHFPGHGGSDPH
ncbi:MAG: hypothetical protein LBH73_06260, partial [Spirochaetaceae bacterium]|nr:hypothetical protein [Spirochaetaceae bacterium]